MILQKRKQSPEDLPEVTLLRSGCAGSWSRSVWLPSCLPGQAHQLLGGILGKQWPLTMAPKDASPRALQPVQRRPNPSLKPQWPRSTAHQAGVSHRLSRISGCREKSQGPPGRQWVNPDSTDLFGVTQNSQKGGFCSSSFEFLLSF